MTSFRLMGAVGWLVLLDLGACSRVDRQQAVATGNSATTLPSAMVGPGAATSLGPALTASGGLSAGASAPPPAASLLSTHAAASSSAAPSSPPATSLPAADAGLVPEASGAASMDPTTPAAPRLRFVGRFAQDSEQGQHFAWSGSGVVAAFEGQSVSVTLEDGGSNQFTVLIDGQLGTPLKTEAGAHSYVLAENLGPGSHQVELYRRTEASFGVSQFRGFDFGANGKLVAESAPSSRRIEVIGDSISCGYGNEGETATCGFSADTENHYQTYGAIAARALDAEIVTIAWSGKGIVNNYGEDVADPLPALYDRTLPGDASSQWDFSVAPDAVVINLGTNDFSTDGDPSPELFRDSYIAFLEHLRAVYPQATLIGTVGPMLSGADLEAARAGIAAAVDARQAAGDAQVRVWELDIPNDSPGCDYHPDVNTHQAMATALVAELKAALSW
jgi:lysophospholipase L1-like esterase